MKLKKLDARNKGYGQFVYMVSFHCLRDKQKFCEVRNWCWQQWGTSCELDLYSAVTNKSESWSWLVDEYRMNIYLTTDKEYQWFLLRWYGENKN